jgi:NAD(P)-dependent dehydrogenase (short-subunit alcohol dehydrogenase family)
MTTFTDKVAVITGAASGIGRALADRCVAAGMKVVLADVEAGALADAERELQRVSPRVLAVPTDVSDAGQVEALACRTVEAFGAVHLLFNNAGVVDVVPRPIWESTLADWEWQMNVNLWGVIHGLRAFVPLMLRQGGGGHIVNTASLVGLVAGTGVYAVTKHAVVALSESLQRDLRRQGSPLRVSVLCPAGVKTRILDAERNRPAALRGAAAELTGDQAARVAALRQAFDDAAPPEQIADAAFEGIRRNTFYILPHRLWDDWIRRRAEEILRGDAPGCPMD